MTIDFHYKNYTTGSCNPYSLIWSHVPLRTLDHLSISSANASMEFKIRVGDSATRINRFKNLMLSANLVPNLEYRKYTEAEQNGYWCCSPCLCLPFTLISVVFGCPSIFTDKVKVTRLIANNIFSCFALDGKSRYLQEDPSWSTFVTDIDEAVQKNVDEEIRISALKERLQAKVAATRAEQQKQQAAQDLIWEQEREKTRQEEIEKKKQEQERKEIEEKLRLEGIENTVQDVAQRVFVIVKGSTSNDKSPPNNLVVNVVNMLREYKVFDNIPGASNIEFQPKRKNLAEKIASVFLKFHDPELINLNMEDEIVEWRLGMHNSGFPWRLQQRKLYKVSSSQERSELLLHPGEIKGSSLSSNQIDDEGEPGIHSSSYCPPMSTSSITSP